MEQKPKEMDEEYYWQIQKKIELPEDD